VQVPVPGIFGITPVATYITPAKTDEIRRLAGMVSPPPGWYKNPLPVVAWFLLQTGRPSLYMYFEGKGATKREINYG
jgi:hypothetical protein